MQSAAAGDIEFSFSSSDAAGIALCTAMHAKVLAAQVEFLKQQILSFQNAHGRRREEPMRLSIDRKPPQLKILGRIASDYEAALASVFDHRDVISMPAAMHTFMVLMCKARTVRNLFDVDTLNT